MTLVLVGKDLLLEAKQGSFGFQVYIYTYSFLPQVYKIYKYALDLHLTHPGCLMFHVILVLD